MLRHLSSKFASADVQHEPRAALILNRSSRALPVLYATHSIEEVLGISSDELTGWSFWDCMDASSLEKAQLTLERAKENDSICYLRFHWRDPRTQRGPFTPPSRRQASSEGYRGAKESTSSERSLESLKSWQPASVIEVEAVTSCTSDGLVVIVRHAVPVLTQQHAQLIRAGEVVFASPWGSPAPILPLPMPGHTSALSRYPSSSQLSFEPEQTPEDVLGSIQQMAVFAWAMNDNIAMQYGRGFPDSLFMDGDGYIPASVSSSSAPQSVPLAMTSSSALSVATSSVNFSHSSAGSSTSTRDSNNSRQVATEADGSHKPSEMIQSSLPKPSHKF